MSTDTLTVTSRLFYERTRGKLFASLLLAGTSLGNNTHN